MSSTKSSIGNFLTKLVIYPIGFISSIIVARILGPEDRGIYAYLLLFNSFLFPIFTLGLGSGIIYFISSKDFSPKQVLATIFYVAIGFGLTLSLSLLILWKLDFLGETAGKTATFEITMLLGSIITGAVFYFISRMLLGDSKFAIINWLTILQGFVNPVMLLIFVALFKMGIHGASLTLFLINLLSCTAILIFVWKQYRPIFDYNHNFVKKSFSYGLKGWLGDIAVRANVRLDQFILATIASPFALGVYSIAVLLVELIWIIPDAIGPVLFNKIAAEPEMNARIELTNIMNRILLWISLLVAILLIFLVVFLIIPIGYGIAYKDAIYPFLILIPGAILFIIAKVITKLLSGSGRIGATSTAMVVGSLISIGLNLLLIPKYGTIGAAIGSSLGYIAIALACIFQFYRHFSKDIASLFVFKIKDFIWAKNLLLDQINKNNLLTAK